MTREDYCKDLLRLLDVLFSNKETKTTTKDGKEMIAYDDNNELFVEIYESLVSILISSHGNAAKSELIDFLRRNAKELNMDIEFYDDIYCRCTNDNNLTIYMPKYNRYLDIVKL